MALLQSAPLAGTSNYFTVASASTDVFNAAGFPEIPGRVQFGRAPDGAACLVTQCSITDAVDASGGRRGEIAAPELARDTAYWLSWDVWVPSSFPYAQGPFCIAQMHDTPDVGNPIVNVSNVLMFIGTDAKIQVWLPTSASFNDKTTTTVVDKYYGPRVKFDQWVKCSLFVNFSTATTGFIEVYYDRQIVCKVWRQKTDYANTLGPYCRLGVYDFSHLETFTTLLAYFKGFTLRDGTDGAYASMGGDAKTSSPKQLLFA